MGRCNWSYATDVDNEETVSSLKMAIALLMLRLTTNHYLLSTGINLWTARWDFSGGEIDPYARGKYKHVVEN